jgi:hypothetical protein
LSDVEALPRVSLAVPEEQVPAAMSCLADPTTCADGEVLGAELHDGRVVVTFGHEYERRTALLRRCNTLQRIGIAVRDFAWLDPVTDPSDAWLDDAFSLWESGRDRDATRIDPIEIARRRFGRLCGQAVLDRLVERVSTADQEQRRWTIAHAAVRAGFNTHTTEAGDTLVRASVAAAGTDGHAAMSLLDGARDIAELGRFGMATDIGEAPLIPLIEHKNWRVHGAATRLLAALNAPRSDEATDALVRLAHQLSTGTKATEIRAEQVVAALATTAETRTDVDDALDALRAHVTSNVRVDATTTLARRRPERARAMWEPWLTSRSANERTAAEQMIAAFGDERDVREVVRIVQHRVEPPKGTTFWPPLSAEALGFLSRHADIPEAAAALDDVRRRWDRHDDDLRRWLRLHHPDLVPPGAD